MLFTPVKDAIALCRTPRQGDWESPVFKCPHPNNPDPEALYVRKGKYFVRINRKLAASESYSTMDGKTSVVALYGIPDDYNIVRGVSRVKR